jgi:hypothetical protein
MMDTVRSYLHSTRKQPHIVRSYFHKGAVRYVALWPVSNEYRS